MGWRLQVVALRFGDVINRAVLADLQGADIGGDVPAVFRADALVVAVHRAKAVGDDVEEVTNRGIAQALVVKGGRVDEAALGDHAVAVSEPAMADGAEDFELLMSALQVLACDREWESVGDLPVDAA